MTQLFRPADFRQFPPRRFRMAYKFSPNGDCEWLFLAPDDDHRLRPGKWAIDSSRHVVLKITSATDTTTSRIVSLSKDLLRLVPIHGRLNP